MSGVVASIKLSYASYQRCSRTLAPGQLKRVTATGPLVGYFIACPACGFSASYLDTECGFVEEPPKEVVMRSLEPGARRLLTITRPPACFRCRRRLRVLDGTRLEALEP